MIRTLVAASSFAFAGIATAGTWTLSDYGAYVAEDHVVLRLAGGSDTGCSPAGPFVESADGVVTIAFEWQPPTGPCFSAPRPWFRTVVIDNPTPGVNQVRVVQDSTQFGNFNFDWYPTAPSLAARRDHPPTEGIWWSSAEPGTGLAFNVDNDGRWFAAFYLYDNNGDPTFLTMQGESLAYGEHDIDFAAAVSPLIRSEGGQCLGCPWSQPLATDTGQDALLLFRSRTSATLRVDDWTLDLTPLPMSGAQSLQRPIPVPGRYYILTVDSPEGRHVATTRGVTRNPYGFLGASASGLECVDCRTVNGNGGSPPPDDALVQLVNALHFNCLGPRPPCQLGLDGRMTVLQVDKYGRTITAGFEESDTPSSSGTKVRLDQLPEAWR